MAILTTEKARSFLNSFVKAWVEVDADLAISLVSPNFKYWWDLTKPPVEGHAAYRQYWIDEGRIQHEMDIRWKEPLVVGNTLVSELWVTMRYDGAAISDPESGKKAKEGNHQSKVITSGGCSVFEFNADGLCSEMREYRFVSDGIHDAPKEYSYRMLSR